MLAAMRTLAVMPAMLPAAQVDPAPDAVGRWSVLMLGLLLLALFIVVAGLVLAARRRARRENGSKRLSPPTPGLDPWTEAGRRTPTPAPQDDPDDDPDDDPHDGIQPHGKDHP